MSRTSLVFRAGALATLACLGCNGAVATTPAKSTAPASSTTPSSPSTPPAPVGSNAMTLGAVSIHSSMYSGENSPIYVTVTNTGAATWNDDYQLGVVGDMAGDAAKFLNDPQLLQVYP